nr:LuxR C-terminal-related transcriptional regulator [Streptomyces niphimycinicus]
MAIRTVAGGEAVIAPSTSRRLLDAYAGSFSIADHQARATALAALTDREREVFDEMTAGYTNAEIARHPGARGGDRQDPRRAGADEAQPARRRPSRDLRVRERPGRARERRPTTQ